MAFLSALENVFATAGVHLDLRVALLLFFLIFARLVSALALVPFIGGPAVPSQIKVGLAAVTTFVLFPTLSHSAGPIPSSSVVYLALLSKELLVGALFGFITQLVFYGVQIAGIVIDTQRGLNQITYLAPQLPGHVSILGNLQFQASIVLFLAVGGHLRFLQSLANSFSVIPLLHFPHLPEGWMPVATEFAKLTASALLIGAQLCAPVVLTLFLIDVAFACIGRVSPSIRISNDANTTKSWIGLAVFILSISFFIGRLQEFLVSLVSILEHFVQTLR